MDKWIKVDTEQLRAYAGGYKEHSETIGTSGEKSQNSIIMVASAMPDYDGRLQQAARPDALEIGNRCRILSKDFMDDSELLIRIAKAFEDIDGQTVKVIGDCGDASSRTSLIDLGLDPNLATKPQTVTNPDGSVTTTTVEIIQYPDGSSTQIITERTTYLDGSVHEKKTITTAWQLDAETANAWNEGKKFFEGAILFLAGLSLDVAVEGIEWLTLSLDAAHEVLPPDEMYADGDTVTSTLVVETDYAPDGTPLQQGVTNTTTVVDKNDVTKFSETTGIDPSGALK